LNCLAVLVALCAMHACRRREPPPARSEPQQSGTIDVYGLTAPVRVVRDRHGVPHIYAQNRDDLFFAQGFVQAQDRLFQMDLWRRSVQGRLAEVLGGNFAERDAMTRRMQPRVAPAAEWRLYGPDADAIARAFVRGVNTSLARLRPQLPEAFALAGFMPELWAADDLLNRTDAFTASADAIEEVLRARFVDALGAARAAAILPGEPIGAMPRGLEPNAVNSVVSDAIRAVGAPPFFLALARPVADAGTIRTPGDIPLDPRLFSVPSRRYLVHLNAPGWNVIGATVPWLPGVESGHNDRAAWTIDPVRTDTQDVFVERMHPSNAHEVEEQGRWVPTTTAKAALRMRRRAEPFAFDIEWTRHGVVVAVDRERQLAFTVRWSGVEPGAATNFAGLSLDRAASSGDIRAAVEAWRMPPRRIAYDDVAGDRGEVIAGVAPVRRGWSGRVPAPGWTGANEWTGWTRPVRALPESAISRLARAPSDRVESLLRDLRRGESDPRALVANAVADLLRGDREPAAPAIFAHVLSVTPAARRRFDVGPLPPVRTGAEPFAIAFDPRDWDRSTAINPPGQSESPDNRHYADQARAWAAGESIALPFTDAAVQGSAESTLTMRPPR
jgi:penicillin amidase